MRFGRPDLSIVVVGYRMNRELPRTLRSLSRSYQIGVDDIDYDVLVVDNGSPEPLPEDALTGLNGSFRGHRIDPASPSPAAAVNLGVRMTRGRYVGVILDGARLVTPGAIAGALRAARLHPRAVVTTMAWHLGPEHQSRSIAKGYGPAVEDALLEQIAWPTDGYRLFDIAALAAANPDGMLGAVNESCFLVVPRELWEDVGGADERFDLPGGGLVSLDLFTRLVTRAETQLLVVLGEGSFHQVHTGASTRPGADHSSWHEQYQQLRGEPYVPPPVDPIYVGRVSDPARRWLIGPPPA